MTEIVQLGREYIITELQDCVANIQQNNSYIRFLAGDAGIGKTTMLEYISMYTEQVYPDTIVAWGFCQSQHGLGEPYLPFKQILTTLIEQSGTKLNESHVHHTTVTFRSFILDIAPDLIGLFFPPAGVIFKTGSFVYRRAQLTKTKTIDSQKYELTKTELFEQCFKVIKHICTTKPIVLILEDLHWADVGTLDLLFYISQRIKQESLHRLFILGSYRIVDALTHTTAHSSILSTVFEINRYFGDTVIDLTDTTSHTHARAFVDAIIDRKANIIGAQFREQLTRHTEGHPLFTIELLHHLQLRGKLYTNSSGKLVVSTLVDFHELPDKVEAIIAARLNRLNQHLKQFVACASVIGLQFRIEWIRQALRKKQHTVAPLLQSLEHIHRILKPVNSIGTKNILTIHYKFQHSLFQQYIYSQLNEYQRLQYHLAIATVLEQNVQHLPTDSLYEIAYHYDSSGMPQKALPYYIQAADYALQLFAIENSLQWFNRALELLSDFQYNDRYYILSNRRKLWRLKGNREAEWQDLDALEITCKFLKNDEKLAEVYLWQATYFVDTLQFNRASQLCDLAGEIALKHNNQYLYLQYLVRDAAIHRRQDNLETSSELLAQALHIAEQLSDTNTRAEVMLNQGMLFFDTGQHTTALIALEQALSLYLGLENIRAEATCRYIMSLVLVWFGRYQEAEHHAGLALDIFIKIGDRKNEADTRNSLGINYMDIGQFHHAQHHFEHALSIFRAYKNQRGEALILFNLGLNYHFQHDVENGLACLEDSLHVARIISGKRTEATVFTYQGFIYESMNLYQDAMNAYQRGLDLRNQLNQPALSIDCIAGLARTAYSIGQKQKAIELSCDIHEYIQIHGIEGIEYPFKVLLTCIQIFASNNQDQFAHQYIDFAYNLLQRRSKHITDESMNFSYFSAFPEHAAIIEAWKLLHQADIST
jgi:adenylate cyclase